MTDQYDPFLYPPNYKLAHLHKKASMPGSSLTPPILCPCCQKKQRQPFKEWLSRSIDNDFKRFGGSVVTYFWLLKLYIGVVFLILILYSAYLTVVIQQSCSSAIPECKKMLGIWIISNESLLNILRQNEQDGIKIRLLTLRGIAFVILMLTNAFSLIVVKKFKQIYPTKIDISDYSIIFKNTNLTEQEIVQKLKSQFQDIEIRQVLRIQPMEPFYSTYKSKVQTYYQALNVDQVDKKSTKLKKQLNNRLKKLNKLSQENLQSFNLRKSQRIIVTFQALDQKQKVLQKYHRNFTQKFKKLVSQTNESYCEEAPRPQQIIWNNIGSGDNYKAKYKILSIVYFFGLLAACYLILFLCMSMVYGQWFVEPWNTVIINVILFFLVYVALTFRAFMNKLSQLSHPSTYTSRTKFIVVTTISFHLIFYIIIPTFYFSWAENENKSEILKMISNQVLNFIIFQFIIVGVDLMHCCWNRKLKDVENQQKPYACQYLLHQAIQYPRFPIQFKLIILFKLWSFTLFFSFQSPFILFLILAVLIFLFFKDKHSLYFHYRMEIIDNKVQFQFLKIYTTYFSLYGFVIFALTQKLEIQLWLAAGFTIVMIIIQLFYIGRNFESKQSRFEQNGSLLLSPSFDQLQNKQSYKKLYDKFISRIQDNNTDMKIKQYLIGEKSIKSEQMLNQ